MAIAAFQAGEPLSALDAVFLSSGGFLFKASGATQSEATAIGVALDSGETSALVRVSTDTLISGFSGLTPGETLYLSIANAGSVVDYTTWEAELAVFAGAGAFLTSVGRAVSTTDLEVEIQRPIYVTK